jgi:hypothetical protein
LASERDASPLKRKLGRFDHNATDCIMQSAFEEHLVIDSPEPPKVFTDFWTLAYGVME